MQRDMSILTTIGSCQICALKLGASSFENFSDQFSSASRIHNEIFVQLPLESSRRPFPRMNKITIAVGSKRGPKLNAVTEALRSFSAALAPDAQFEVVGVDVESGVSHTPLSRDELMRGARQRAEALVETASQSGAAWQYVVGVGGGLYVAHEAALAGAGAR